MRDVNTDQQDKGLEATVIIDRDTASRLGVTPADHRQRSVRRFRPAPGLDHVQAAEPVSRGHGSRSGFSNSTDALQNIYVRAANGTPVPLAAFAHFGPSNTPLAVSHQGQFPSVTLSFNLRPTCLWAQATDAIDNAQRAINFPPTINASFQGTAAAFQIVPGQRALC